MSNGWAESAGAWIASMGERGDWGREHVLDPAMLARLDGRHFEHALDVGCGEGRFCRILKNRGIQVVGIDPTEPLLDAAISKDPAGDYRLAEAEDLPFADNSFDLVVSYLTLIDIAEFRQAINEMVRVLVPGGTLLVANLTSMGTSGASTGWIRDGEGRLLHWPVDRYSAEYSMRSEWAGIRIVNWHRPLSAYMSAFLQAGLDLVHFDEPAALGGGKDKMDRYHRMPWFNLMEWALPQSGSPTFRRAE